MSAGELAIGKRSIDYVARRVHKRRGDSWEELLDSVVEEVLIAVHVDGQESCTLTCSPWNLKELVIGHLFLEGILANPGQLGDFGLDEATGRACVRTRLDMPDATGRQTSALIGDDACPPASKPPITWGSPGRAVLDRTVISSAEVQYLMNELETSSTLFHRTGGVHNAQLAHDGKVIASFSDLGRHNAVDKIAGWCFLNNTDTSDKVLVFSGRMPSEIISKVVTLGCPIIISRGAPTDLSLELAAQHGITVIGFTRADRFNVYTHEARFRDLGCPPGVPSRRGRLHQHSA